ncbi:hypothetical protein JCM10908_004241 [Rhodotorula pacifica]|uniref:tRNA splicing endonuclease subunit SEN34 n=1 Tax=Rhodotorula pacifica TaxID=1495444 RepID=UPI003175ED17
MVQREPVKLRVANQKAYLWDLNDVQYLRVQHHICGVLSGTLPQVTQQNVFLGLPLVLMPEEVVLLVRNGIAVIVDDRAAHLPPTPDQAESYHASRAAAVRAQQETHHANEQTKKREMEELHRDKIEKRRREKEAARRKREEEESERRRAGGEDLSTFVASSIGTDGQETMEISVPALAPGAANTGPPTAAGAASSSSTGSSPVPVAASAAPSDTKPDLSHVGYTIIIEPRSDSFAWYEPYGDGVSYSTLEAAKDAGVWNYPLNTLQEARCRVFEDLWRRGFYMGGGMRFGGDFLVYPGDPLRYHSHFTLTVLSTPTTTIMPLDLVAYGRLATAVKKAHLLGSWDAKAQKAEYASLEWAAFG